MARKKLVRFQENAEMRHVVEPSREEALKGLALAGHWAKEMFRNDNPIVLELGCGKGEYTVAMARRNPDLNYIGVDIKGARIWYGATEAKENDLKNVAFLRTQIELIEHCFAPGEISEIWITFPDPQIKHERIKHRLTHPEFLDRYRKILSPGGTMHLKTDSEFLHGYTIGILQALGYPIEKCFYDIDKQLRQGQEKILHEVQSHYEMLFRSKGKSITYIRFHFE